MADSQPESIGFTSGAFAVFEPDDPQKISRFIPFRFNPEALSRQLQIEQGEAGASPPAAGGRGAGGDEQETGADADSGSLKESFSIQLRFDLADREEGRQGSANPNLEFGVLPEISALEDLLHPAESATEQPSDGSEPTRARQRRPLVLFVWGEKRVVPVKIAGLTINETLFNGKLYPIRAEVEVALETLGDAAARDNKRVKGSLDFTSANRRKMARIYLDNTAQQATKINLPYATE